MQQRQFHVGYVRLAAARYRKPLWPRPVAFPPPLLRFTADVRAAETEMVGGEHCGCTGGCNNNDFSGIGGHIGLMGNGWFQYRIWSRMAKMICGAIRRLLLPAGPTAWYLGEQGLHQPAVGRDGARFSRRRKKPDTTRKVYHPKVSSIIGKPIRKIKVK